MIEKIGIVGAGQMGAGIAQVCAVAGYQVRLMDISATALDKAVTRIAANLDRQAAKNRLKPAERDAARARIVTGTDYDIFGDCDLVVEAAIENEQVKREILKKLCAHLKPSALIGSNS